MFRKYFSSIAGASILIALTTILSRGLGFFREIIFANNFGFDKNFDLYLAASIIPFTIQNIVYFFAQNYYVPLFTNEKDEKNKKLFFNQEFMLFVVLSTTLTVVLIIFSNIIINLFFHDLSATDKSTVDRIFQLAAVGIPLAALSSYLIANLYVKNIYTKPSVSQMVLNVLIIVIIIILTPILGIYSIPIAFILGNFFQLTYLIYVSKEYFNKKYLLSLRTKHFKVSSNFLIVILIEILGSAYILIDRYFINYVNQGDIAALNYAHQLYILPIIFFSFSLATVIFPKFSADSIEENKNLLVKAIKVNLVFFIPIAFILYFYGDVVIRLIYMRGKFLEYEVNVTTNMLKIFSVSLLFYSIYSVLNKLLYIMNKQKILLGIYISTLILKIVFNYIFVTWFGGNGLALSTTIIYFSLFFGSFVYILFKIPDIISNTFKPFILYSGISFGAVIISSLLNFSNLISIIIFSIIYFIILLIIRDENFRYILKR